MNAAKLDARPKAPKAKAALVIAVLALAARPPQQTEPARKLDRAQVNRLGIDQAARYGAAHLPLRDNSRWPPGAAADLTMAENIVPHFHNTPGVPVIDIGAKEFQCIGATPPFDHPHVYLDMGEAEEIICPYCSTLYRHDASLNSHSARPPECAVKSAA